MTLTMACIIIIVLLFHWLFLFSVLSLYILSGIQIDRLIKLRNPTSLRDLFAQYFFYQSHNLEPFFLYVLHPVRFHVITMAAQEKHLQNDDSKPLTLCLNKVKNTVPHEEDELLAKALLQKKIALRKINLAQNKAAQNATHHQPKKTCICAPTSHSGSFRCHLHRISLVPRKPSLFVEDVSRKLENKADFKAKNGDDHDDVLDEQPKPSRFGMAVSARIFRDDNLPFTMPAKQVN